MKPSTLIAGAAVIAGVLGTGVAAAAADPSPAPSLAAPSPPAAPEGLLHGESVVKDSQGRTQVYTWQTGTVTARTGTSLTVRGGDGVTYTWSLNGETRHRTKKTNVGDTVMVGGPRDGDARTAAVVSSPPDLSKIRESVKDLKLPERPEPPEPPRF